MNLTLRQKSTQRWFGLGLLALLLAPVARGLLLAEGGEALAEVAPRALPVGTLAFEAAEGYELSRAYTGEVTPRRSASLGFERAGLLREVLVDDGVRVEAGEPLARLDVELLEARRDELRAERAQLEAELAELVAGPRQERIDAARAEVERLVAEEALSRKVLERRRDLVTDQTITVEELDRARSSQNSLAAQLEAARFLLEELETGSRIEDVDAQRARVDEVSARLATLVIELAKSTLLAPFSGLVAERLVDEGAVLGTGEAVLRLLERDRLEARIGVPGPAADRLEPGGTVELLGRRAPEEAPFRATVRSLVPEVDAATRTVTLVLELDASCANRALAGEIVRLELPESVEEPGGWLPTAALARGVRGLWSVFVLAPESAETPLLGSVERREVEVLHTEGDRVFVRGLLEPGELVLAGGVHRVVPGQRIESVSETLLP